MNAFFWISDDDTSKTIFIFTIYFEIFTFGFLFLNDHQLMELRNVVNVLIRLLNFERIFYKS